MLDSQPLFNCRILDYFTHLRKFYSAADGPSNQERTLTTATTNGLIPLTIEDPKLVEWDDTADVLVIGFGGAGACAAIEAREAGCDVLAIDRFAGGGATAYSGGIIYAGGTRFQQEAGFEDDADQLHAYLSLEVGDVVRPETLRRYCAESDANLYWLIAPGVPSTTDPFLDKTIYPTSTK